LGAEELIMAWPREIFINYAGGEANAVRAVSEIVGRSLEREDRDIGTIHRCRAFEVEIALWGDHGLEDDSGIEFTKYDYQLNLNAFRMSALAYEALYDAISLYLAERLSETLACETLVVENLERKVAVFPAPARDD
jgi:hypothetical protein